MVYLPLFLEIRKLAYSLYQKMVAFMVKNKMSMRITNEDTS